MVKHFFAWPEWLRTQVVIWLVFGGGALLVWGLGGEGTLARFLYQPDHLGWAWQLRQFGTWPAAGLAALALGVVLVPFWLRKNPVLYKTAVIVVLSTTLGTGLLNQVIVKDFADRPRPREFFLKDIVMKVPDGFKGNSMPSGHAGMGFALAAPFFPLRRRYPRSAWLFLGGGVLWGLLLGVARMVVGAHFLSDVLIAGAIGLSSAAGIHVLTEKLWSYVHPHTLSGRFMWYIPGGAVILGLLTSGSFIWFNPVRLEFHITSQGVVSAVPPCVVDSGPERKEGGGSLKVLITGYGAPVSNLKIVDKEGILRLESRGGVYRNLACIVTWE